MKKKYLTASLLLSAALVFSGCSLGGNDSETGESPENPPAGLQDVNGYLTDLRLGEGLTQAEASLPQTQGDGEFIAKGKFQVLSLDRQGDYVRMVAAWLKPAEGPTLGSRALATGRDVHNMWPTTKLWDPQTNEVFSPLQTKDGTNRGECVCSSVSSRTAKDPSASQKEQIELYWVDFPAPANSQVRVIPNEWISPPAETVTITDGSPFHNPAPDVAEFADNQDLPSEYGNAEARAYIDKLDNITESPLGSSTTKTDNATALNVTADVLFDFDKSEVNDKGREVLRDVADTLNAEATGQTVTIVGHTDAKGDDNYNQKLSEDRAKSVQSELEPQLNNVSLKTEGRGESEPVARNFDDNGEDIKANQEKNRRVSFEFQPADESKLQVDTRTDKKEVPTVNSIDPAGDALASAEFVRPDGDAGGRKDPLRIDIHSVSEDGEYIRINYSFAITEKAPALAYFNGPPGYVQYHFGVNGFGAEIVPSGTNVSLVDAQGTMHFSPQAAERGCLCTEGAGTDFDGYSTPSPMYGYFPKKLLDNDTTKLRIGDSGQWEINLKDLLERSK